MKWFGEREIVIPEDVVDAEAYRRFVKRHKPGEVFCETGEAAMPLGAQDRYDPGSGSAEDLAGRAAMAASVARINELFASGRAVEYAQRMQLGVRTLLVEAGVNPAELGL